MVTTRYQNDLYHEIRGLEKCDYEVQYECGMNQYLADALSRAYLPTTLHLTRAEFENINVAAFLPVSTSRLWEIQQATEDDEILQALKAVFLSGWPDDHSQIPEQITPYFSMRDKLSVHDGVIFHRRQIVVPVSLREDRKQNLHASHLGTESCLRRAQETIFWLNMNTDLKEMIETCETCRKYETCHQKESLIPHEVPSRPWKQVGVDLFELNKKEYLITVDYYSNFCEVDRLTSTTSSAVLLKLKNHFARYGCPNHLISDYGLSSHHQSKFTNDWDFEHRTSSLGNSNTNGKVESAALSARTDPYIAILDYRNTATQGIESNPAQCLMNRRTRTLSMRWYLGESTT